MQENENNIRVSTLGPTMTEPDDERCRKRRRSRKHKPTEEPKNAVDAVDESQEKDRFDEEPRPSSSVDEMAASDNEEQDEVEEENVKEKSKRKRKRKRKKHGVKGDEDDVDEARNIDLEEKLHSLDHTIYVEGLPFDATEEEVREFFVSGGCTDIVQLRLPRWQDSGRLRGYGHVVFDSRESRQKAIAELNRKNLGARYVSIQAPKEPRGGASASVRTINTPREPPEGCCVVFIKNLPYHATEEDIQHEFETCGKIVEGGVRIARNSQTRQSKGFCYVEFKNPEGAQGAVEKAAKPFGMKVLDRPVFVDYDEGRMKGSFKTEDGRLWSKEFGKKS